MGGTKQDQQLMDRPGPFWDFSLRTYRMPGVANACLALQDEYSADINLLLYCCWVGARSGALCEEEFQRAFEFSRIWAEHVVRPMREVRRWMKRTGCDHLPVDSGECMALREQIKVVELGAEKLQQFALESLPLPATQGSASPAASVVVNLQRYFQSKGIPLTEAIIEKILVIVCAAWTGPHSGEWGRMLRSEPGAS